jgi:hypothetical protein
MFALTMPAVTVEVRLKGIEWHDACNNYPERVMIIFIPFGTPG